MHGLYSGLCHDFSYLQLGTVVEWYYLCEERSAFKIKKIKQPDRLD